MGYAHGLHDSALIPKGEIVFFYYFSSPSLQKIFINIREKSQCIYSLFSS